MKRFALRRLISLLCISGALSVSTQVFAGGFQLWEQDVASIGNFHAGYAAAADNASIAFYNPAGITLIKHQQLVFGAAELMSDFKFNGTISVNTLNDGNPQHVVAQGGASAFVPDIHYVTPLTDKIGFGFSIDAPFGSKVDYGRATVLQYAVVRVADSVVDISPSLGLQLTDKFSFGIGFDAQKMRAQFDQTGVDGDDTDTDSTTRLSDTGYGVHLGGLYQFSPTSRIGLSYHSQVVHHLSGTSKFTGTLADQFNNGPLESGRARTNITLPAYTALSLYHQACPKVALMGSVVYTQWNVIKNIILQDVAGIEAFAPSTNILVNDPQHFRNTWSLSLGMNYFATDNITLRAGVGYDQTPSNNSYRNVQLPDNNRYAMAIGGHYQTTKNVGFDVAWAHIFMSNATIHPPQQVTGDQVVSTEQVGRNGSSNGGADVFGAAIIWNIT